VALPRRQLLLHAVNMLLVACSRARCDGTTAAWLVAGVCPPSGARRVRGVGDRAQERALRPLRLGSLLLYLRSAAPVGGSAGLRGLLVLFVLSLLIKAAAMTLPAAFVLANGPAAVASMVPLLALAGPYIVSASWRYRARSARARHARRAAAGEPTQGRVPALGSISRNSCGRIPSCPFITPGHRAPRRAGRPRALGVVASPWLRLRCGRACRASCVFAAGFFVTNSLSSWASSWTATRATPSWRTATVSSRRRLSLLAVGAPAGSDASPGYRPRRNHPGHPWLPCSRSRLAAGGGVE